MTPILIKYFTLLVLNYFIYIKLTRGDVKPSGVMCYILFSTAMSFVAAYFSLYMASLAFFLLFYTSLWCFWLLNHDEVSALITATMLSFALDYMLYALSVLFLSTVFHVFRLEHSWISVFGGSVCIALAESILCYFLFRFRRLGSGMIFIKERHYKISGMTISAGSLVCVFLISGSMKANDIIIICLTITIIVFGISIVAWWRKKLKQFYIESLKSRELESLKKNLLEKDSEIQYLRSANDFLASTIHRDNKLIPSMLLGVEDYLNSIMENDSADNRETGEKLIKQLQDAFQKRTKTIEKYICLHQNLPPTHIFLVDNLMQFMAQKASCSGVGFDLMCFGNTGAITENSISASDLQTILADLVENAIISTLHAQTKKVLVSVNALSAPYGIEIFDTGLPFDKSVICHMGERKTTTHKDTGGSGIGLMTVWNLLKEYRISLTIDESLESVQGYTKKIVLYFDRLAKFTYQSKTGNTEKPID